MLTNTRPEYSKYRELRTDGHGAADAFRQATEDGLDVLQAIRMLRSVYNLSLEDAKSVMVVTEGLASNLSDYQQSLVGDLEAAQDDVDSNDPER